MTRILAAFLATSATIFAVDIPVANASFDSPTIPVGSTFPGVPGWQLADQSDHCPSQFPSSGAGIAHPAAGSLVPSNDGSQTGYAVAGGTAPPKVQICQAFQQNFAQATIYVFSVDFAHAPGDPPIVASIQLSFHCPSFGLGQQCLPQPGDLATVPPGGGTVSVTHTVPGNSGQINSIFLAISVYSPQSGPITTTYFSHARLQAIPLKPQSYGLVGMYAHQPGTKSVLSMLCANANDGNPCAGTLEYLDIYGVLVSQQHVSLRPGMIGSLEQLGPLDRTLPARELIPVWFLTSGKVVVSLEMFDTTGRTSLFTNWADGSVSRLGNLFSGPIALTALDTGRLKVYCDGSVRNTTCDAILSFTDAVTGQVLMQSRVALTPGAGSILDISFRDSSVGLARGVIPAVTVNGGRAVANVTLFDATTGNTLTQSVLSPVVGAISEDN